MKNIFIALALFASTVCSAEVKVGAPAPAFSEVDQAGATHSLDSHKGKWIVLEWYNEGCPFVKKHYGSKNMQTLQSKYTEKDVVWLTVASSAKGQQGYVDPKKAVEKHKSAGMAPKVSLLLDADGTMGRAYDAKTTPHMFVIDPKGVVVYAGAIDSDNSSDPSKIAKSTNYVAAALDAGMAAKPVTVSSSKPYGCGIKYK